jgi:hypothetical protein
MSTLLALQIPQLSTRVEKDVVMVPRRRAMTRPAAFARRAAATLVAACVLAASTALACNVPVFRYALEHWRPDAYRGVLFHRGPLSTADQDQLTKLKSDRPEPPINVAIRTVDLDASPAAADVALAESFKNEKLPRLVVQYPARLQIDEPLWSGAFTEADLKPLLDSPARQQLIKRLIAGETAVWLLVESGDAVQDDAAALTLEAELQNLKQNLKLPVQTDAPEDAIQDGPDLRVAFSVLRVRRDDPAEKPLVAMLLNSEPDLAALNEPLVYPVFGRCRSLLPLVGLGISTENIRISARFLAGACSCQVKEQNPGFDLLLTADWSQLIPWAKSPAYESGQLVKAEAGPPELVPIATGAKPAVPEKPAATPVAVTQSAPIESPAPVATSAPSSMPGLRLTPITAAALALVLIALAALLFRR